jgi:hypothetical protein
MAVATLTRKIDMLPLYKQQEVMDFVDFLMVSPSNVNENNDSATRKHPYAGCMSGTLRSWLWCLSPGKGELCGKKG